MYIHVPYIHIQCLYIYTLNIYDSYDYLSKFKLLLMGSQASRDNRVCKFKQAAVRVNGMKSQVTWKLSYSTGNLINPKCFTIHELADSLI